jgi:hypothetical protein
LTLIKAARTEEVILTPRTERLRGYATDQPSS